MRLAAVVLAAGRSSRMGRNKSLLEVAGRTVLDRLLDAIDGSTVGQIVVVLGHNPDDIIPIAEAHGTETVLNVDYDRGMTSSLITGLKRVDADAAFLVLGDQLGLEYHLLDEMGRAMADNPLALIVSPVYEGRRGHPTLFRDSLFPEILSLGENETMKDIVVHHEPDHYEVEGDLWCTMDFDTPEDFERAVRLFEASRV